MKKIQLLVALFTLFTTLLHAQQALIGKTNFATYIDEAPGLPATLEEAAKWYYGNNNFVQPDYNGFQQRYQPFYNKIDRLTEQYKQVYGAKIEAYNEQQGEAGIRRNMEAEVNKNPIVAQMGGVEKIQNMSEEEAKAAALQASAQMMQNPGMQSAGMTALYQKVVSDPAYAARFEKMSDKEKEAELRKYMAGDQVQAKTPQQMAQAQQARDQQSKASNDVANALEINQFLTDLQTKLMQTQDALAQEFAAVETAANGHDAIESEFASKLKAIPVVELGEYGRDHDPAKVKVLKMETVTKHRNQAITELKQNQVLLNKLKNYYKQVISEYSTYIQKNADKINGDPAALYNGTNTELAVANFEMSLLSLATDIAQRSQHITSDLAHWEAEYQLAKQAK